MLRIRAIQSLNVFVHRRPDRAKRGKLTSLAAWVASKGTAGFWLCFVISSYGRNCYRNKPAPAAVSGACNGLAMVPSKAISEFTGSQLCLL